MALAVDLVSPEEIVFTDDAELVIARTTDGEIGFQRGHVPFLGMLLPGEVRVHLTEGRTQVIAVHSGFVEMSRDHLTVLSDLAELAEDIDVERARAAMAAADEALQADEADAEALASKRRAEVRLQAAGAS